ncbi:hypothetical protein JCM10450v2_003828 [Rhodotorula kratochvilovae]
MSTLTASPPMPREAPARALVLVDGNAVLPERSNLLRGAQGGSLASYSLHENLRRAISQEAGRDCQGTVMVFADIAQLATALRIPAEVLVQFARGFSSTSAPSTFNNVLQSSTLSTMNAHLTFHARAVDYVVLIGYTTDLHAHWLSGLVPTAVPNLSNLILVETAQPFAPSVTKLVKKRVRFQGLMDAVPVTQVKDITDPPSDHEEGAGIDHDELGASPPRARTATNGTGGGSTSLGATSRVFTTALLARSTSQPAAPPLASPTPTRATFGGGISGVPLTTRTTPATIADLPLPASASAIARRDTGSSTSGQSVATAPALPSAATPTPPPGLSTPSRPAQGATRSSSVASSLGSPMPVVPGALPLTPSPPRPRPASAATLPPPPSIAPPPAAPAAAAPPSSSSGSTASGLIALPRPPAVPERYLPLLRVLLSLSPSSSSSSSSAPAPLFSAVGTELARTHQAPAGKLAAFFAQAQKDGWVNVGRGEGEGSEWVRISARGRRAMVGRK